MTTQSIPWEQFKQRCRAHRRVELLEALGSIGARAFDYGRFSPTATGWNPWALAAAAREALAYGNDHRDTPVTHLSLARLLHAHNNLEDPLMRGPDQNPWDALLRIVFQQFGWASSIFNDLARFEHLMHADFTTGRYECLSETAVRDMLGAAPRDLGAAALLFTVAAERNAGLMDLAWIDQPEFASVLEVVPAQTLRSLFHNRFGTPLQDVAAACRQGRNSDPALRVHDFNPLLATPFVGTGDGRYVTPTPRLVAAKASLGSVYYAGVDRFGNAFARDLGRLLERYVGQQLAQIPSAVLVPEREYRTGQLTVDWIVVTSRLVVLVEVKSARVAQPGRLTLDAYSADVSADVGKGFRQLARTVDLVRDRHPSLRDIPVDRPLRGLVVTAEPHHLINAPIYRDGLPDPGIPVTVVSLEELEHAVAFTRTLPPDHVLDQLTNWTETAPVNLSNLLVTFQAERGVTARPRNPLLDTAWRRVAWETVAEL